MDGSVAPNRRTDPGLPVRPQGAEGAAGADLARIGGRASRLGLAVGPDRVVAVTMTRGWRGIRPSSATVRLLEPGWGDHGREGTDAASALAEALVHLRDRLGIEGLRTDVALLPGLGRGKVVDLPPAGRSDLRRLAVRNAGRHFVGFGGDEVVADAVPGGGWRLPFSAHGRGTECTAVCADAAIVESVLEAVSEAGLRPGTVTAGSVALVSAVTSLVPESRRDEFRIDVRSSGWRETIRMASGEPRSFRIERAGGGDSEADEVRVRREGVDAAEGHRPPPEIGIPFARDLGAPGLAAFGAAVHPEDGPLLLPSDDFRAWRARLRRRAASLAGVGLLFLVLAAGVHLFGVHREIAAVRRARGAIGPAVEEMSRAQANLTRVNELLRAVSAGQVRGPSPWTRLLAELARALPSTAHLRSLEADGRRVHLSGTASSAPSLVPLLASSPEVEDAVLLSARRVDAPRGGEEFELLLTLDAEPPSLPGEATPALSAGEGSP